MYTCTKVRVIKRGGGQPGEDPLPEAGARLRPGRGVKETVGSWVTEFELRRLSGRLPTFESLFETSGAGADRRENNKGGAGR